MYDGVICKSLKPSVNVRERLDRRMLDKGVLSKWARTKIVTAGSLCQNIAER